MTVKKIAITVALVGFGITAISVAAHGTPAAPAKVSHTAPAPTPMTEAQKKFMYQTEDLSMISSDVQGKAKALICASWDLDKTQAAYLLAAGLRNNASALIPADDMTNALAATWLAQNCA